MGLISTKECFKDKNFQYPIEIDFQIDAFKKYIDLTEMTIEKEVREIISKYEAIDEKYGNEELFYDPQDYEIRKSVALLYFNSIFISIHSFLERKLHQLCTIADKKSIVKLNSFKDKGITKYIKYCKEALTIDMDMFNGDISYFYILGDLRNKIIHDSNNEIEKTPANKKIISTFKMIKNLNLVDNTTFYSYSIDKILLLDFCQKIRLFLDKLYHN